MTAVFSLWQIRRRRIFLSAFQTENSQSIRTSGGKQEGSSTASSAAAAFLASDQTAYDRAWHVVTTRLALPSSATADDSLGTLLPESRNPLHRTVSEDEYLQALRLVIQARMLLPRASRSEDIVSWHTQQVRAHFGQHILPLLNACVDDLGDASATDANNGPAISSADEAAGQNHYERYMVNIMSSIRTLDAALRLYSHGLQLLTKGLRLIGEKSGSRPILADAAVVASQFQRDMLALIGSSVPEGLTKALNAVLSRLIRSALGVPLPDDSLKQPFRKQLPRLPAQTDLQAAASRKRLSELVAELHRVGLAGEQFQRVLAEVMDSVMSQFITRAFARVWVMADPGPGSRPKTTSLSVPTGPSSPCIDILRNWIENHFVRLSHEVLSLISGDSSLVSLSDSKMYQSLALGRLAALRVSELFDIVLAWPSSRGALDDLRATITTPARRSHLTSTLSRALQKRLLHPGSSTLEILQTYIAVIRTMHALDHSKVLLGQVEPSLQLYLCQREDAVRIVVTGLLQGEEEFNASKRHGSFPRATDSTPPRRGLFKTPANRAVEGEGDQRIRSTRQTAKPGRARASRPSPSRAGTQRTKALRIPGTDDMQEPIRTQRQPPPAALFELGRLLNDPNHSRRITSGDEEVDWDDMDWTPDPVDAGDNYRRPKSEDVIGTLISALGSGAVFIKEFTNVVAERLLSEPKHFKQELKVLELLKRRFGEAALQHCDVMVRDVQESERLNAHIRRGLSVPGETGYHARILSRLFWPGLEHEHFVLPTPVSGQQQEYECGYGKAKGGRKLTWLNQMGQARVELQLRERVLVVDCTTIEATVIYAFGEDAKKPGQPVRHSVDDLYATLQMNDDLIRAACKFWVGQGVLQPMGGTDGQYQVVEAGSSGTGESRPTTREKTLDEIELASATREASGPAEEHTTAAASSQRRPTVDAREQERRAMYWQYICGMLTNSSATMALGQMAMMLKMLIADGFPWSNEELQEFLGEKVAGGELEIVGGRYKLARN